MKIDVSELKKHVGGEAEYSFTEQLEPLEAFGETITFDPVEVRVKIVNAGESITAYFHVETGAHLHCSRCLKAFREPIVFDFQVVYQEKPPVTGTADEDQSDDIVFYENDLVDVSDDVRQQVLLALPMKPVCSPECKGLCPKCGQNLNEGLCDCPREDVDARWSVLRGLFNKD